MNLKQLRMNAGRSQEDMARELKVSLGAFRNWERGRVIPCPSLVDVPMYLRAYQCDLNTLIKAIYVTKYERDLATEAT
jgi:transcriptional regulator with XRE-family HTH domain